MEQNTATRYADEIIRIVEGHVYYCPECGETDLTDSLTCPECGAETLQYGIDDYLYDYWYNDEIVVSSCDPSEVKDGQVMIACGGPNVWVNTHTQLVSVYWWGSVESAPITEECADRIREVIQEVWDARRSD